jgi:hypothetical protein
MDADVPEWLRELKESRNNRPCDKGPGRWLGDFLDEKTDSGLLPAEFKLLEACRKGELCVVADRLPSLDEKTQEPENLEVRIRAKFLRFLAMGGDESVSLAESGIDLKGAFIDGGLDLLGAKSVVRLLFYFCYFKGRLRIAEATLCTLSLRRSRVAGIAGNKAKITNNVALFDGFDSEGEVSFNWAEIGGDLNCESGGFRNEQGHALDCIGAKITGGAFLSNGFISKGEVSFNGAEIGGELICNSGIFKNPQGRALSCIGTKIKGSMGLLNGDVEGEISFFGADIRGDFHCSNAVITGPRAMVCDFATVGGTVWLDQDVGQEGLPLWRFVGNGEVSFYGATISGNLNCSGGRFNNPNGNALTLTMAKIGGGVFLNEACERFVGSRFDAEGTVDLYSANVRINLDCTGGRFNAPGKVAIQGTRLTVAGSVLLRGRIRDEVEKGLHGFTSDGELRFVGAQIGLLDCSGGEFDNKVPLQERKGAAARALNLGIATITEGLLLDLAQIKGSIDLTGARTRKLYDKEFVYENGPSPEYFPKIIRGPTGERFNSYIFMDGFVYDRLEENGCLTAKARKAWLKRQPPEHLAENFHHEPFDQLATTLKAMGRDDDARKINIFKQQLLTRRTHWFLKILGLVLAGLIASTLFHVTQASVIVDLLLIGVLLFSGAGWWLWRMFLSVFAGYGHRPGRAIAWILVIGMLAGGLYQQAAEQGVFVPKDLKVKEQAEKNKYGKVNEQCGSDWTMCPDPQFHPLIFSFDTMLPIGHLGVAEAWKIEPKTFNLTLPLALAKFDISYSLVQSVIWFENVFGWLAGGVILAVVSGLLKRS